MSYDGDEYWKAVGVAEERPNLQIIEQKHILRQLSGGPGAHSELLPQDEYRVRTLDE